MHRHLGRTWLENAATVALATDAMAGVWDVLWQDKPQEVANRRLRAEPLPEGFRVAVRDPDSAGQDFREEIGAGEAEVEEGDEARREALERRLRRIQIQRLKKKHYRHMGPEKYNSPRLRPGEGGKY